MKSGESTEEPKRLTVNSCYRLPHSIYFLFSQDTLLLYCHGYEIKQITLNYISKGRSITLSVKMLIITASAS